MEVLSVRLDAAAITAVLKRCRSLNEADVGLQAMLPLPSKATRFGLFDGWNERPFTLAGLALGCKEAPSKITEEYRTGYEMGCDLRRKSRD